MEGDLSVLSGGVGGAEGQRSDPRSLLVDDYGSVQHAAPGRSAAGWLSAVLLQTVTPPGPRAKKKEEDQ